MQTQRVFQAGNSQVVAIPKAFGFRVGHKVIVEKTPDGTGLVIRRAERAKKVSKTKSEAEFQSWLTMMLKEDKELLDELANR